MSDLDRPEREKGRLMAERLAMNHELDEAAYQRTCARQTTFFRHNYLQLLPRNRSSRILDIGCGLGHFLSFCRTEGYAHAQGIDLSTDSVAFCQGQGFSAEHADALPFLESHEATFDAIVLNDVIEHIPKPDLLDFLDALHNALAPGGVLIMKTINAANPILGPHGRYLDFTHETSWTEESMHQVLEHRGFVDVRVLPSNLFVFYRNPLNYVGWIATKSIELIFLLYFRLNGRNLTRVFTKNLLAVGRRPLRGSQTILPPLDTPK